MRLIGLAVLLLVMAVAAGEARACSCGSVDPEAALRAGKAAFEGVVVARKRVGKVGREPIYDHAVRVLREYNAELPARLTVRSGAPQATCGAPPLPVGRRFAVWVEVPVASRIEPTGCDLVSVRELRQAAAPLPRPRGRGRLALLVGGRIGHDGALTAYDDRGRLLAYGFGGGRVLTACPGGERFLQQGRGRRLLVRSSATLRVLRTVRFPVRPVHATCRDRGARDVVVIGAGGRTLAAADRVLSRTTDRGIIAVGGGIAVAISGEYDDPEDTLHAIDLGTGAMRELARVKKMPSPGIGFSPGGRRMAFSAFDLQEADDDAPASLYALDLQTGQLVEREIPADDEGTVLWTSDQEFLLVPVSPSRPALRFDAAANPLGNRSSLRGATTLAVFGDRILGVAGDRLYAAPLGGGRPRALRRLMATTMLDVVLVPERPRVRAPRRVPARRATKASAARRCPR